MISAINDEIASNIDSLIRILNKTKIKYIELRKIDDKYLFLIENKKLKKYSEKLKLNKIKVSLIDSPIGKNKYSMDVENKIIHDYIKICKIFNCKYLRIFSDTNLKEYNELAKKNKITILLENEKNTRFEDYKEIINEIKNYSNIKILYDAENYYSCNIDYLKAMEELEDYIKYVHIRDIKDGKYVYLYDGEIDIKKIKEKFKKKFISLETHLPMVSTLPKEELFKESLRRIYE